MEVPVLVLILKKIKKIYRSDSVEIKKSKVMINPYTLGSSFSVMKPAYF